MERAEVFDAVAAAFVKAGGAVLPGRPATDEELERVHTDAHVRLIGSTAGRAVMLDADTFTSPESADIARLAAGTAVEAAQLAFERREATLVLARPPGHHAARDTPMGFCLYNNIAVAAAALLAAAAARVAIVDFDVHHGNGTQAIFYEDPAVFYASSHQFPFYPGTGASTETGAGAGLGTTLNVPLPAGTRNEGFLQAYQEKLLPAVEAFRPDLLLVSAGFDAHERDPIAGMKMTSEGFEDLVRLIRGTADRVCHGRSMWIVEGGYHLGALRECLDAAVRVLT
jgi:acetoin utilization deacetylase AcuC-like enzyme